MFKKLIAAIIELNGMLEVIHKDLVDVVGMLEVIHVELVDLNFNANHFVEDKDND